MSDKELKTRLTQIMLILLGMVDCCTSHQEAYSAIKKIILKK